jgi:predicted amidohydrolase YtcJ
LTNPSLVARLAALQVIPVPFSCYVTHHGEKMHFYGEERLRQMFALRTFLDAGLKPSASSDYTASPFNPMLSLQSMVTRTDWSGKTWGANQRITVEEALRVLTIHGAYASYEEKIKGSIEAGKLADLAVLSDDPFTTDPMELSQIRCERTMLGGRWVYES